MELVDATGWQVFLDGVHAIWQYWSQHYHTWYETPKIAPTD